MGFQRMVDEFLIGRFDELRMAFPEVRGQLAVCLGDSIKNVLGEFSHPGVSAALLGAFVIKTSLQHQLLGHRRQEGEAAQRSVTCHRMGWDLMTLSS